jgi:hypothetical protein
MSRANPFGDLDDFTPQSGGRPVVSDAIEQLAQVSGFPSRKAQPVPEEPVKAPAHPAGRQQRRHVTGRNRQINIKATEATIATLYRIADNRGLPLGAVLELALSALENADQ